MIKGLQEEKDMKYMYCVKDIVYIGSVCPNCNTEFNLLDRNAKYEMFNIDGEQAQILFCGKCRVDHEEVKKKIEDGAVNLKQMDPDKRLEVIDVGEEPK